MERSSALPIRPLLCIAIVCGFLASALVCDSVGYAQVRTKKPDRGVYRSPVVGQESNIKQSVNRKALRETVAAGKSKPPSANTSTTASKRRSKTMEAPNSTSPKPLAVNAKWGAPLEETDIVDIADVGKSNRHPKRVQGPTAAMPSSSTQATTSRNSAGENKVRHRAASLFGRT